MCIKNGVKHNTPVTISPMSGGNLRILARTAGLVIGMGLVAWAVVVAAGAIDWLMLAQVPPHFFAVLVLAVWGNLLISSYLWHLVTRGFEANPLIGLVNMVGLIQASALLNYLPFRPGLFGRAAYLKLVHQLPLRHSALCFLIICTMGLIVSTAALGLWLITRLWLPMGPGVYAGALVVVVVALSFLVRGVAQRVSPRAVDKPWLWLPVRTADLFVTAARLWLAFEIIGHPIGPVEALGLAAADRLAALISITPGGLGVREWVIALVAPAAAPIALSAALIDRAAEAIVVAVVGAVSLLLLRTPPNNTSFSQAEDPCRQAR